MVSCRSSSHLQLSQQQLLARWVHSLNPVYSLTCHTICKLLRDGEVLLTILALTDSARILTRRQIGKPRTRTDAINNLDVILQYIYDGKVPSSINSEFLYTTQNPKDWWDLLFTAFYRKSYLLIKRREKDLMSLLHPANAIPFPFTNISQMPTNCLVYVYLLYNYFLIPADFLSLITLRPNSIKQIRLNWSIVIFLLNQYGIKLIFTTDELCRMCTFDNNNNNIYTYMQEYMLFSLLDTLQARMKTAPPGEGMMIGSLVRELHHEHPDKEFYYCFADCFVIVHLYPDQDPTLEYVSKSQKNITSNMLSLNRCSKYTICPCTVDYKFVIVYAKISRNPPKGSIESTTIKWSDCSLILSPMCMLIVTLLDEIYVALECIKKVQVDSNKHHIVLVFSKVISGISTLMIYSEGSDFSALACRLNDVVESKN